MSFLVYCLIIHLCFSMHACNSRHLGVFHKQPGKEFRPNIIITTKVSLYSYNYFKSISCLKTPGVALVEFKGRNLSEDKESKLSNIAQKTTRSDIKQQVQISDQEENKIVGWKNHGRSTMESKLQDSKEAIHKSKENGFTEDVVVMDYAQPHRKPPIHNIQP
ncbi:hypothetical protein SSX86_021824 [Deinandra increscens subsp. villosa]|uniref:Uncharacterized protein n=1 Tax=Deinandra increscens subsp. villosa TaxID=3103831 RepID=A0AAP0GU68_9ASTR